MTIENVIDSEIADAEAQWEKTQALEIKEMPDDSGTIAMAERVFKEQILPISAVAKRALELGVSDTSLVTRDKEQAVKTVNGMFRKINGQADRVKDFLVEGANRLRKGVFQLHKDVKGEVARQQKPYIELLARWAAEDAEAERQKILAEERVRLEAEEAIKKAEEAERQRLLAAENARLAAEAEANRKEQERLLAERQALEAERAAAAAQMAEERKAMELKAAEEKRRLDAELDARLAKERAEQEVLRKAEEARRVAEQENMRRIEAELAEFRAAKARVEEEGKRLAEKEAKRQADEAAAKAERERKARLAPDKERLKSYGDHLINVIASAPSVTSPEAQQLMQKTIADIKYIADRLQSFGSPSS
jgi:hypothetical protein